MGTAVFHPRDCLTAPQRDRNLQFSCASERPYAKARPCRRAFSANPEALAPFTDYGRNVTPGTMRPGECRNQTLGQGHFLGGEKAAEGLLPVPGQETQSAHPSTFHRCPSLPMFDSSASACFSWNGIQVHERRLGARQSINSLKGECRAGSWFCTATASQKLNFSGNSHFSDVLKHGHPRWTGIGDQKVEYRKRMQPDVARGETYPGQKVLRPPLKVLPAAQAESICTNTTILGRKHSVGKQLKRSASEKRQEVRESPSLQRPGTEVAIKKLMASSCEGVFLNCNGRHTDVNPTLSTSTGDEKRAKDLQVSWDANPHGRMGTIETGIARSLQETMCKQIGGTERNVVASLQTKCYGSVNIEMQCQDKIKGDKTLGVPGYVSQCHHACMGDVEKNSRYSQFEASELRRHEPMAGSKLISRDLNSLMHNDGMWVSLMHAERWAGPSFFNSPSPSSLPIPSFTVKFSRSASTGTEAANSGAYVSHITANCSLQEENRSRDVVVATNDLRRMLNLDHAPDDV